VTPAARSGPLVPLRVQHRAGALAGAALTVSLASGLDAPRQARALVASACAQARLRAGLADLAVLLTSEAVTNAVVHAGGWARTTVLTSADGVAVEVEDASAARPVTHPDRPAHLPGGRGVALIDACSSAWGFEDLPDRPGKVVWFELRSEAGQGEDHGRHVAQAHPGPLRG